MIFFLKVSPEDKHKMNSMEIKESHRGYHKRTKEKVKKEKEICET